VLLDDLPEIHPVELVAGEDQDQVVGVLAEMDDVAADGVGRPLVPVQALLGLLGREDVDEAAAEGVELVGALDVRWSDAVLNCVSRKIRLISELMQLLIGMSTSRYLPARGTAGLQRSSVRGASRVPRPPPMMTASTRFWVVMGIPFLS
jgi:hypothetical protein